MDGKTCPNCYTFKPVDAFGKRIHNGKNIMQPYCIECKRLLDRQYRIRAAYELGRSAYGFEIDRNFYQRAKDEMLVFDNDNQMSIADFPEVLP